MLRLGLIGCGVIGSALVDAAMNDQLPRVRIIGILGRPAASAAKRAQPAPDIPFVETVEALIALAPDLVFEAAGHQAVARYGPAVLAAGLDLALMSVGALAEPCLHSRLVDLANCHGAAILIPSGAIGGLDILRAASTSHRLDEVVLTSTKRPAALAGQPYVVARGLELGGLNEPLIVFDGTAAEACLAFPMSTNIAASVSLAGLGFDRTRVRVIADPHAIRTVHSLQARGGFGELELTLNNIPHPKNPRTSILACLSAVASVQNSLDPLRFL